MQNQHPHRIPYTPIQQNPFPLWMYPSPAAAGRKSIQGAITAMEFGIADILVEASTDPSLIGTTIQCIDLSGCIFDEPAFELIGVWVWASQMHTSDGLSWVADNRCCI